MIPWRLTYHTFLSRDQVLHRIADNTDQRLSPSALMPWTDKKPDVPKTFGGKINWEEKTFLILKDPYEFDSYYKYKIFYEGHVEAAGGKTTVSIWIRPSAVGLMALLAIMMLTFGLVSNSIDGSIIRDWDKTDAITLSLIFLEMGITYANVRAAKRVFDDLLLDKPVERTDTPKVW